MNNNQRLMYVA